MIDKSGWKKYRFSDIAENIAERIMPSVGDEELYIGLEHMDTGSLHITRWGSQTELIGQKLKIRKGDILFARRNAYLKRVAIAPFDGIFSAHGMVLRPKKDKILEEFFPFFVFSDVFLDRAIQISVGSLSPTVNWTALKVEEFLLPPIEEQKRMAELLWAADEVAQKYIEVLASTSSTQKAIIERFLSIEDVFYKPLGEILEICQYGLSLPLLAQAQYPVFRMMNIIDGKVVPNDLKYIDLNAKEYEKYKLLKGDILFNRTNSTELVGKVGIFDLEGDYVFASYLIRLRAKKEIILPEILNYTLNADLYQQKIRAYISFGVSQSNINAENLKKVKIPIIPISKQQELLSILIKLEESKKDTQTAHEQIKLFMSSMINLGGAN